LLPATTDKDLDGGNAASSWCLSSEDEDCLADVLGLDFLLKILLRANTAYYTYLV